VQYDRKGSVRHGAHSLRRDSHPDAHLRPSLIRTESAGSNSLLYGYRASYPTTGSVYCDMVRDRNVNSGYGNWVFVPDTCF
jgi:hypothetical protein